MISKELKRVNDFIKYNHKRNINLNQLDLEYPTPTPGSSSCIGYLGWVGHGNYGDDVIFKITQSTFGNIPLKISDSRSLWQALISKKIVNKNIKSQILGGGTLIFRSQYIKPIEELISSRASLFCFGTGVADTEYWKKNLPSENIDSLKQRWVDALKRFEYIGVRGPISKDALQKAGINNVEILGDAALAIKKKSAHKFRSKPVIGISVGAHDPVEGGQNHINDLLGKFVALRFSEGFSIRFLQFSSMDIVHAQEVAKLSGIATAEFINFEGRMDEFTNAIGSCDFIVGERLHSVVMAAALGIPFVAIGYQPKCLDFVESIDCKLNLISITNDSSSILEEKFQHVWNTKNALSEKLIEVTNYYSSLQLRRAKEIGLSLRQNNEK